MRDLTKTFDYARLIAEEKAHFSNIVVTEELKEGGVHANKAWDYYWQGVGDVIGKSEFANLAAYLCGTFPDAHRPLEVLSLASGFCGHEIDLARRMTRPYKLTCTELNEAIFESARAIAKNEGLAMDFETVDLNFITIERKRYDLIFAHAAIHHVINLEYLFEQIVGGLSPIGVLHLAEVVGKNRKLIWDENERYANALLDLIPDWLTRGIRIAIPDELGGMEGIRQEDILPLLRKHFSAVFEHRHGAFIRFICTHAELGPAFDPQNSDARRYLDFLIDSDDCCVRHGILRPLEIWGVYRVSAPAMNGLSSQIASAMAKMNTGGGDPLHFTCPCCQSHAYGIRISNIRNANLIRCGNCEAEMFWPVPPDEELAAYYTARNGFTDIGNGDVERYLADPLPMRGWAASIDEKLRSLGIAKGARILELGCMHGTLSLELQRLGYDAWGVEPSQDGIKFLNEHGGQGYCGTIHDENCPVKSCDVALSFHVFEHLADPYATLRKLHGMMPPGGVLYFAVPHWGGLVAQRLREKWKWFSFPEHLHYYSRSPLLKALEKIGFTIVATETHINENEPNEVFEAFNVDPSDRTKESKNAIVSLLRNGMLGEALHVTAIRN